jgi:hypothetical protein
MLSRPTLPNAPPAETALDQQRLYALGLEHVRALARKTWTDHNIHDPGITTLELLCYALTDLAYRASLPIEDLLTGADSAAPNHTALFTARQILPNRPLTLLDYRKLLIDLKGVKNAWIKPAELTYYADTVAAQLLHERPDPGRPGIREVRLRGLYEVLVEPMDEVTAETDIEDVLDAVRERLAANRNLGEDFVAVTAVHRQDFMLCAELELAPEADVSRVQAEVLFQVDRFLAPPVVNYSLSEMLERKKPDGGRYTVEEIFDGPLLDCGFIDDAELARAELRTEIHLSDLISLVMRIDGVRAVADMVINPVGAQTLPDKWRVPVASGAQPTLAMERCRLVFYKRNMPVVSRATEVAAHLESLVDREQAKLETPQAYDLPVPRGRQRQPGRYYSFQNHFPAVYGLSEHGAPAGAGPKPRAQAFQLKAYLLFFDQIMADYCAQLARMKDLFAVDPALHQTYFHQVVDSFIDFKRIYQDADEVVHSIEMEVDDPAVWIERRSRFLDHLVARFGERFHDYAAIMLSSFGASPQSLTAVKCEFLESCPTIGAERGLAYDASLKEAENLWNTGNVSGLERRLAKLLGLSDARRRNLSEISYDVYAEIDATPGDEFRFRVRHRVTGKILLSGSTRYATREAARQAMLRALSFAQLPAKYERLQASDGRFYFNVVGDTGDVVARRIEYFATEAQRDAAIDELIAYLKEHYSDEGMYLIENILLRPEPGERFLPICVDPNCTDCADDDPYSYRIHVVLPAWAGRFGNMEFRRFAEEVIRQETPAHVLPKVCWISREDMAMLEGAYRAWLEARAGASAENRKEKLEAFIAALYSVKNVYPSQTLQECDAEEEQPKFIVGQTALGSAGTGDVTE